MSLLGLWLILTGAFVLVPALSFQGIGTLLALLAIIAGVLRKKSTVEESIVVGMSDIRKQLYHGAAGTFTWTWASGHECSISYFVTWNDDAPTVTLQYRWQDTEDVRIPIQLPVWPTRAVIVRRPFAGPPDGGGTVRPEICAGR